jgi:hypothetical protein
MWVQNGNDFTRSCTYRYLFADTALDKKPIGSNRSDFSAPPPAIVRIEPPALIAPTVNFAKCIMAI